MRSWPSSELSRPGSREAEEFFGDRLRLDAVIKNLAVIARGRGPSAGGRAAETSPQIPWSKMRGVRNVVVHEYFGIDA